MNLPKTILLVTVVFSFLITDTGDCFVITTLSFLNVLLVKLLLLQQAVIVMNTVGLGALFLRQGSVMLMGALDGASMYANIGNMYLMSQLMKKYNGTKFKVSKPKKYPSVQLYAAHGELPMMPHQYQSPPFDPTDLRDAPHLRWPGFKTSLDWAEPTNMPYKQQGTGWGEPPPPPPPRWRFSYFAPKIRIHSIIGPLKNYPKHEFIPGYPVYDPTFKPNPPSQHQYENQYGVPPSSPKYPNNYEAYNFVQDNPNPNYNFKASTAEPWRPISYNSASSKFKHKVPSSQPMKIEYDNWDCMGEYHETEEVLINALNQLGEADEATMEERYELILRLREAYKLKLLLEKFAIQSANEVPAFVPFPDTKPEAEAKKSERKKRSNDEDDDMASDSEFERQKRFLETLTRDTKEFFTLISAFDNDACIQEHVCEVHTKSGDSGKTDYDQNIISMFKLANILLEDEIDKGSSVKYTKAASFGQKSKDSDKCKKRFKSCKYSYSQIIDMGNKIA